MAKLLAIGWPLVFPYFLAGKAGTSIQLINNSAAWCRKCANRITERWFPFLRTKLLPWKRPPFIRYASPEEEARFWAASAEAQKRLDVSNANAITGDVPLVRYYVPRLLPLYRNRLERKDAEEHRISAKVFCKWHRMVFRGPVSQVVFAVT